MGIMNHVIFNGTDLTTFGLYVSGDKTFDSPEKNYTKVSIPGRSGDLYIWDGTYKDVNLKYSSILIEDFDNNAANLRNFLLNTEPYSVLEDDYHPAEFRLATYKGPLSFKPVRLLAGSATLEFICRPERFLKTGAASRQLNANPYTITNPTPNTAKPLLEIAPSNSDITISFGPNSNSYKSVTITAREYAVYLDSEYMDLYSIPVSSNTDQYGGTLTTGIYQDANGYVHISPDIAVTIDRLPNNRVNRNSLITLTDGVFPELLQGDTVIASSAYSLIKLTPRWFIL